MPTFIEFFSNIFEPEMKKTRTLLEAIPDDDPMFTPHEKSMRLDKLAGHTAHLPGWIAMVINEDKLEIGPQYTSRAAIDERRQGRTAGEL